MKSTLIKTVLAVCFLNGVYFINQAHAVPNTNAGIGVGIDRPAAVKKQQKKKVTKKQQKRKPVKRQSTSRAPQAIQQAVVVNNYISEEETASQYWSRERERQLAVTVTAFTGVTQKQSNPVVVVRTSSKKPIAQAKNWVGYDARRDRRELSAFLSRGNDTKVDPAHTAWCAAFMNAVLRSSGYEGTNSLMARSFLAYGTRVNTPQHGDIVVFRRGRSSASGHVAFFDGIEYIGNRKFIRAVGGNQNKAVTVALYPADKLLGIRRI